MSLPKVLIFGQPFNNTHGGGITLSNLFKGWEKDKIAVAATGHLMYNVTTDVCDIYYQLGNKEFKWRFPFNLIQRNFSSGLKTFDNKSEVPRMPDKSGLRYILVNRYFYPALEWLGLFHCSTKIEMSQDFKNWLSEFRPDILYLQVSTREAVLFAADFTDYLKIPSVIHVMDDWPSTISKSGPLKKYWRRRIDREFKLLLDKVDLYLSISDAMSSEYRRRYNKSFVAFHNPINLKIWQPHIKTNFTLNGDYIKILYSGRIGPGITDSLVEVAEAIESLNMQNERIKLYIQSPTNDQKILKKLRKYHCIVINPVAEYSSLPVIFSNADILVIVNDFDKKGINFLKYSMPTKASEYMISGTPVLVYAHYELVVSKFFTNNNCGCCVTDHNPSDLVNAIKLLINDQGYRKQLSNRAVKLASELFDAEKVRRKFQNLMVELAEKKNDGILHTRLNN